MHRTIRRTLVGLAAGSVMLLGAGVAQASTQPLGDNWTLTSPSSSTTSYTAQVQQPINPDGTSTWSARRGVIPVQFKLTKSTENQVLFESIAPIDGGEDDFSALSYTPPEPMTVNQLRTLMANFTWEAGDSSHGGSLRWSIRVSPTQSIFVYYGDAPNWTGTGGSGVNLLAAPAVDDLRFDTSQVGGTFYDSWTNVLDKWGTLSIVRVSLVVDSGWQADQVLHLVDATVNDSTKLMPASTTTAPVQTNEPTAQIEVVRYTDGIEEPFATESLASAQGDTDGIFRQVDGKYIYNLKAENLGKGDFKVYMKIDGQRVDSSPGIFSLK